MDNGSNIFHESCPQCQGNLVVKTSKASGKEYQACNKSQGGCGWWTGQKEGEVSKQQSFPQKRNFSVNQGGHGNFRGNGGAKLQKPNPQTPVPTGTGTTSVASTVVEAKPDTALNELLLELFRERLQKDELLEGLVREMADEVTSIKNSLEVMLNRSKQ